MAQDLYDQAVELMMTERRAATFLLQRRLDISYDDARKLMERMEAAGVVTAPDHVGKRQIRARAGDK